MTERGAKRHRTFHGQGQGAARPSAPAPPRTSRCRSCSRSSIEVNTYLGLVRADVAADAGDVGRQRRRLQAPGRHGASTRRPPRASQRARPADRTQEARSKAGSHIVGIAYDAARQAARRGARERRRRLHVHRAGSWPGERSRRRRAALKGTGALGPGRRLRHRRAAGGLRGGRADGRRGGREARAAEKQPRRPEGRPAGAWPHRRRARGGRGAARWPDRRPAGSERRRSPPAPSERAQRDAARAAAAPSRSGLLLVSSFDGPRAPAYLKRRLRQGTLAGVILFSGNVTTPAGLRSLTRTLQRAAGGRALVMVDQEGGGVRRIPFAAPAPAQAGSRHRRRAPQVRAPGRARPALARGEREPGARWPTCPTARDGPARLPRRARRRSARLSRAAIGAYARGGVAATAKHFPGLGAAAVNTDFGPVVDLPRPSAALRRPRPGALPGRRRSAACRSSWPRTRSTRPSTAAASPRSRARSCAACCGESWLRRRDRDRQHRGGRRAARAPRSPWPRSARSPPGPT